MALKLRWLAVCAAGCLVAVLAWVFTLQQSRGSDPPTSTPPVAAPTAADSAPVPAQPAAVATAQESPSLAPDDVFPTFMPDSPPPGAVPMDLADLRPEHVDFVRYIPPIPPGPSVPRPLYGARPADRPWIEKLLRGLSTAQPVDPAGAGAEHRRVDWTEVRLLDGRRIRIRAAWNCESEDGGTACRTVPGKLVIAEGDDRRVVASPQLEAFLYEERVQAMPPVVMLAVTPADLRVGDALIVQGDGYAGATAFRLVIEGGGQRRLLAEGPLEFGVVQWTGRLPADLPAGDYQLSLVTDGGGGMGMNLKLAPAMVSAPLRSGAEPPPWQQDLDQVAWAQVGVGLPMPEPNRPLYPERSADAALLRRLLAWLRDAEPTDGDIPPPGRSAYLKVKLRDGGQVLVRRATDCVTAERPDSTRVTCRYSEEEVILHPSAADPVRVRAPALAAWLTDGWRQDASTVAQLVAEPLPDGRYRVHGDGWPGAEKMQIWLAPAGPYSCCPPSDGTRLAVVPVILGQFVWEGELPGEGAFELVAAAEGGGGSTIQVDRSAHAGR